MTTRELPPSRRSVPAAPPREWSGYWCLAAVVVAAGLAAYRIGSESLWFDEAWSIRLAARPVTESVLEYVRSNREGPPLYFLLLHGWLRLFGDGEAATRGLSGVLHVVTVVVSFLALRRLTSPRVAGLTALLVATAPALLFFSAEARNYSLLIALCFTSLWCFTRFIAAPSRARLYPLVLLNLAGLLTHVLMIEVVALENLVLVLHHRNQPFWKEWWLAQLLAAATIIPYLLLVQTIGGLGRWVPVPNGNSILNGLMLFAGSRIVDFPFEARRLGWGGSPGSLGLLALDLGLALAGCVALLVPRRTPPTEAPDDRVRAAGPLLIPGLSLAALLTPLLLSVAGKPYFLPRYLIIGIPAFLALVTLGMERALRRPLIVSGAVVCLAAVQVGAVVTFRQHAHKDDWRSAGQLLTKYVAAGDAVIVSEGRAIAPFEYYYHGAVPAVPLEGSVGADSLDDEAVRARLGGLLGPRGVVWLVMPWGGAVDEQRTGLWRYFDRHPEGYALAGESRLPGAWAGVRIRCYHVRASADAPAVPRR